MPERVCPQCGDPLSSERRSVSDGTVEVDVCEAGDGLFMEEGEIEQLTRGRELFGLLVDELSEDVGAPREECPLCNEIMVSEALELQREAIEVEVCTVCHGLWISKDQLSTLQSIAADRPPMEETEMAGIWDERLPALERRQRIGELLGSVSQTAEEP